MVHSDVRSVRQGGRLSRPIFNASSDFGVQLTHSATFTFGIAPAFLVHGLLMDPGTANGAFGADPALMWGLRASVVFYVLASCLRLAKFNVLTEKSGQGCFSASPQHSAAHCWAPTS